MDTLDCINTRRSIRKFLDVPVEFEKIGNILEAGRFAPSAGNLQDWKFILITERDQIDAVAKSCHGQYWITQAQVVIVVAVEPSKTERFYGDDGEKFSLLNGGAAVQNMLLAIHDQGLASCWVCAFEKAMLYRELGIPDDIIVTGILPVGYPDEKVPVPKRNTLEHVTFIEKWGNRVKDMAAYMEWYGEHVQKAVKKGKKLVEDFARRLQQ